MKEIVFDITINASPEKVWNAMWEEENYKKWTAVFCEGSYAKSNWKEEDEILFLTPNGEGMYSTISKLVPNEKMYFTHLGEVKKFQKQPLSDASKEWSGSRENYTLSTLNGSTKITVEMDIVDSHYTYFITTFPKGLEKIKEIAETH